MAKTCTGIRLDNRVGKTPFKRCGRPVRGEGDYCPTHAKDVTRQKMIELCLVQGWEKVVGNDEKVAVPEGSRAVRSRLVELRKRRPA